MFMLCYKDICMDVCASIEMSNSNWTPGGFFKYELHDFIIYIKKSFLIFNV